jgi:hypothetical protein
MATTLTWNFSGFGTKSGTTNAALIDDIVALVNNKSGDVNYKWQVASSNNATNPMHIVLKRKDASAGRLLLLVPTVVPGTQNPVLFDQAPSANVLYGAWFPAGNADSPSNVFSASGTVIGDDTGAVKVWAGMAIGPVYTTGVQVFTVDSNEGIYFFFQSPSAATLYGAGAGKLVVTGADAEQDCVVSLAGGQWNSFGTGGVMPWSANITNAGSTLACIRTNYGSANRTYYFAWSPNGSWLSQAIGNTDVLSDTSTQRLWFQSVGLVGQTKGEGIVLKMRQFGYGPATTGPFTPYNTTGPVTAARQANGATVGGVGYPWFTNFKI